MEIVLRRGSRQAKQPLGRLPLEDREVLSLIDPPPFSPCKVSQKGVLCGPAAGASRSPRMPAVLGARSSAFERGAGRVCICPLGLIGTSCLLALGAETRA